MFTCFDARMVPCLHALTITYLYAYMPHAHIFGFGRFGDHMLTCPYAHIFLHACLLTCLHASMIVCSHTHMPRYPHVWMLTCSHALMITCSHAHMLWCSLTPMLTCFDDPMLICFDDRMPPWSHALIFTRLISIHMYTWMIICQYAWRQKWLCN